jgi:hypothetical protein
VPIHFRILTATSAVSFLRANFATAELPILSAHRFAIILAVCFNLFRAFFGIASPVLFPFSVLFIDNILSFFVFLYVTVQYYHNIWELFVEADTQELIYNFVTTFEG